MSEMPEVGRYYPVARGIGTPLIRFLWRVHTPGIENLPAAGPVILAANHISFLDSAFLMFRLPRQITFVGKAEYLDSWKTKHLFPAIGMIPVDRSSGSSAQAALNAAAEVLERGGVFGIFPEGTRSRSGDLHKGHTGLARLALRTGAPIVPVGIIGTDRVQPPDVPLPRPFMPATLKFGRPVDVGRYADRADDRLVLRQITDEVMYEIRELTGQTYLHRYATRRPRDLESKPAQVSGAGQLSAVS